jgi:hypothetical protein
MKLRLWPRRRREEPAGEEPPAAKELEEPIPPPAPPPVAEEEAPAPARARPGQPASAFARPYAPQEEAAPALPAEPPAAVSLTLDEAKTAIRAAGGDVIQIGFLARAYLRHREEEPAGREAAAARKRLCDLVAQRLEDRKLLASGGRFELLEEPPAPS